MTVHHDNDNDLRAHDCDRCFSRETCDRWQKYEEAKAAQVAMGELMEPSSVLTSREQWDRDKRAGKPVVGIDVKQ